MSEEKQPKIISDRSLIDALVERGIVPKNCRRITIDMEANGPVMLYYETFADERLIDVFKDPRVQIEYKEKQLDGEQIAEH